ncbi:Pleckstrin homology domain [Rhizoctonia solani]|uniref:Pleckstrin homology domain n=1 Tax=Rhizoctonia solani TaxID=456999 RepID=A0A8H7M3S3_9AGAM|nr:Pleckstrin homology domain [Rhizoctonia solani]
MYRAAGTASSPDLATLISKVRRSREEQPEERERTRSTTSSAFEIIEAHTPSKSRDRALTSPDSQGQRRTNRLAKAEKTLGISPGASSKLMADSDVGEGRSDREGKRASMRNKTSAFIGKMLGHGQGSLRGGNRSTPTTPVATQQHSFAPPVPTIPLEYRSSPPQQAYFPTNTQQSLLSTQLSDSPAQTPSLPSADPFIADTCSTQSSPLITPTASSSQPMNGPRHMKPLPPIQKQFPPVPVDDRSDTDDDTPLAPPKPPGPTRSKPTLEGRARPPSEPKPRLPSDTRLRTTGGANREAALASAATTNVAPRELDHSATLTQRSHARPSFPRQSKDGRRRSMSVSDIDIQKLMMETRQRRDAHASPPRASMDDAVATIPIDQRRMSRRAREISAWTKAWRYPHSRRIWRGTAGCFGWNQGLASSNYLSCQRSKGLFATSSSTWRSTRICFYVKGIPSSPLAARSQSNASSSSMLAVPGTYPASSSGQTLTNQPSMESMRTLVARLLVRILPLQAPPSRFLKFDSSGYKPRDGCQPSITFDQRPCGVVYFSTPRSSSLRLSSRPLPRRQPPRHRSAASASEPSLLEGIAAGPSNSIRLVSDHAPIRKESSRERERDQRLVSDPVAWHHHRIDENEGPKINRRGSSGAASTDMDGRGKELANKCWEEDESFLAKRRLQNGWVERRAAINKIALRYYMDNFDFTRMRLDGAFRHLCTKLYLKAETQQVDRILEEFSRRFWDCNRGSVYASPSIVHAIAYSLLLLNTDLHIAELTSHMSKNQFVRNTWAVIQDQIRAPELPKSPGSGSGFTVMEPLKSPINIERGQFSQEQLRSQAHLAGESTPELVLDEDESQLGDGSGHLTRKQRSGSLNSWRSGSREGQLPMNTSNPSVTDASDPKTPTGSMHAVVSVRGWDSEMEMLLKEMYNSVKHQQILQPLTGCRLLNGSRCLSVQLCYLNWRGCPNSQHQSIRTDDWFRIQLSHTIIKEAQEDDVGRAGLAWPTMGKGRNVMSKAVWESAGKRAKVKTWMDVFVVIQKGELSMFVFGETSAIRGAEPSRRRQLGFQRQLRRQSGSVTRLSTHFASSRLQPAETPLFCPDTCIGSVFFFQAGTEDLVNEWVMTCNYWAARQSKEPLSGGVSNMEYGWNRALEMIQSGNVEDRRVDSSDAQSVRSGRNLNIRMPASPYSSERIFIHDWTGPMHSVMPSTHDEETQMEALQKQANLLKQELHIHNELRQPMMNMYIPRSTNAVKASNNWERRSQYLLSEIVKYDSYVDSLRSAMSQRLKRRGEGSRTCSSRLKAR